MRKRGLAKLWPLLEGRKFSSVIQAGVGPGREVERLREMTGTAKWFGFEPHSDYFQQWEGKYPGDLFNSPLSDACGPVNFYRTEKKHSSSIYERDGTLEAVTMQAVTLDFAAHVVHLDFGDSILLWLDAELAELKIIRGAASIMPQVTFCVCEFFKVQQSPSAPTALETRNAILAHGLKPLLVLDDNDLAFDEAFCR